MAVILQATWIAKAGREAVVRDALAHLAPASRTEPGNLGYTVYQDESEPLVFRIFEIYADQDAVAAHATSDHFVRWGLERAIPELSERKREFFVALDL